MGKLHSCQHVAENTQTSFPLFLFLSPSVSLIDLKMHWEDGRGGDITIIIIIITKEEEEEEKGGVTV